MEDNTAANLLENPLLRCIFFIFCLNGLQVAGQLVLETNIRNIYEFPLIFGPTHQKEDIRVIPYT